MMKRFSGRHAVWSTALAITVLACSRSGKEPSGRSTPAASTAAEASAGASGAGSETMSAGVGEADAIRSVYALGATAPDPRAVRLCAALQELPPARRAACLGTRPGVRVTSECVRTLSDALRLRAVIVSEADVEGCTAAMDHALSGCGWANGREPQPPAECQGIVHGALAEGARCRSSLECDDGLRCRGVGPTSVGRCAPPLEVDSACGGSVDVLAVYTRQNRYEAAHPECAGRCERGRCAPATARLTNRTR